MPRFEVRVKPNMPTLVCIGNELEGLAGWGTGLRLEAHEKGLLYTALTSPPVQRLHPVQRISVSQCVALRLELRALTVAPEYRGGTVRALLFDGRKYENGTQRGLGCPPADGMEGRTMEALT